MGVMNTALGREWNWPLHKLGFNLFFEKGTSRSELDAVSHPHLLFQKYSNIGQTLINAPAPTFIIRKICQKLKLEPFIVSDTFRSLYTEFMFNAIYRLEVELLDKLRDERGRGENCV